MVLGMKFGRPRMEEGVAGLIAGFAPAQRLVSEFEREFGTTVCAEISEVDWLDFDAVMRALADDDFVRKCADVVGRTAEMVAEIVAGEASTQE